MRYPINPNAIYIIQRGIIAALDSNGQIVESSVEKVKLGDSYVGIIWLPSNAEFIDLATPPDAIIKGVGYEDD